MLNDWYQPDVILDFPKGGSGAIVDALVRGIEKNGGEIRYRSLSLSLVIMIITLLMMSILTQPSSPSSFTPMFLLS